MSIYNTTLMYLNKEEAMEQWKPQPRISQDAQEDEELERETAQKRRSRRQRGDSDEVTKSRRLHKRRPGGDSEDVQDSDGEAAQRRRKTRPRGDSDEITEQQK